jgi:hypothetical protein
MPASNSPGGGGHEYRGVKRRVESEPYGNRIDTGLDDTEVCAEAGKANGIEFQPQTVPVVNVRSGTGTYLYVCIQRPERAAGQPCEEHFTGCRQVRWEG